MLWRLTGFVFWSITGAIISAMLGSQASIGLDRVLLAFGGALLGGFCWTWLNLWRASRALNWLRDGDVKAMPKIGGLWGEAVNRVLKLLRQNMLEAKASEGRLSDFLLAIQASPNGVLLLDANGQIEWSNLTAAEHFGLDIHADIAQHVGNLIRDPVFAAYFNAADYTYEITIAGNKDSYARPSRIAVQIHPYGMGKKLMLSHDVTALELSDLMRRDFVANVSHEIRTPLTVLAGFVETLQTLPLSDEEQHKYLDLMAMQAQRMQMLVSDLLTLSKLEGSPAPLGDTWFSLKTLMNTCEQEAKALSELISSSAHSTELKQNLIFCLPVDLEFAGSPTEMLSAMSNLVNNAVRHTPPTGTILVSLKQIHNGKVEFLVKDTGYGIPPEHLSRLTERFYRVDDSRSRESGGTGLGLSIVKHVVQRHGGELHIESTLGVGSTFSFVLPAHRVRMQVN